MRIRQRMFRGEADLQAMTAPVNAFPSHNLHVADLPYRFSSWAMDHAENIGLWVAESEELLGWAVMQTPFWTIDYAYLPHVAGNLHEKILVWADERAKRILDTPSGRPMWFINVFSSQKSRIRDLEGAGFASQADVGEDSWTKVLMKRPGKPPIEQRSLPDGFLIRPIAGEDEVAAYVDLHQAVFSSKSMTVDWRRRTLHRPEYLSDVDLVAVAPDGHLAAFCICWLNNESAMEASGQIEPLGVSEAFRRLGLGRSILSEGLRRLQLLGADAMVVETDNYRDEAFALYESVGFHVAQEVLVYRKDYANAQ